MLDHMPDVSQFSYSRIVRRETSNVVDIATARAAKERRDVSPIPALAPTEGRYVSEH